MASFMCGGQMWQRWLGYMPLRLVRVCLHGHNVLRSLSASPLLKPLLISRLLTFHLPTWVHGWPDSRDGKLDSASLQERWRIVGVFKTYPVCQPHRDDTGLNDRQNAKGWVQSPARSRHAKLVFLLHDTSSPGEGGGPCRPGLYRIYLSGMMIGLIRSKNCLVKLH